MDQIEEKDELSSNEKTALEGLIEGLGSEGLIGKLKDHLPNWENSDESIKRVILAYYKSILSGREFNFDELAKMIGNAIGVESITPRLRLNIARTVYSHLISYLRKQVNSVEGTGGKAIKLPEVAKIIAVSYWTLEVMKMIRANVSVNHQHDGRINMTRMSCFENAFSLVLSPARLHPQQQGKRMDIIEIHRLVQRELEKHGLLVEVSNGCARVDMIAQLIQQKGNTEGYLNRFSTLNELNGICRMVRVVLKPIHIKILFIAKIISAKSGDGCCHQSDLIILSQTILNRLFGEVKTCIEQLIKAGFLKIIESGINGNYLLVLGEKVKDVYFERLLLGRVINKIQANTN